MRVDFRFWQRWLLVVAALIIVFGAVIAVLSWTPVFSVFNGLVNCTFWPQSEPDAGAQDFTLWAYGMLGATMVGWGVFLAFIVRYPFADKERWARDCVAIGVAAWFLIDTSVSVWMRAYFNVVINLLILVLIALPMIITINEFTKKN